jgi:hypothetical protein
MLPEIRDEIDWFNILVLHQKRCIVSVIAYDDDDDDFITGYDLYFAGVLPDQKLYSEFLQKKGKS